MPPENGTEIVVYSSATCQHGGEHVQIELQRGYDIHTYFSHFVSVWKSPPNGEAVSLDEKMRRCLRCP